MSIDRCKHVRQIIESQFIGSYEKITQEFPEDNGTYAVSVQSATLKRGGELRHAVLTALAAVGFRCEVDESTFRDGLTGFERMAIKFRVNVGGVRSL